MEPIRGMLRFAKKPLKFLSPIFLQQKCAKSSGCNLSDVPYTATEVPFDMLP